jgi:predicted transglutaminase-like cysteine proteinase
MRARTAALLLIALLLLVQVAPAEAATSTYKYTETYTFENRGTAPATLMRDDIAVPLFLSNEFQTITITSSSPSLGAPYADEDGNMLSDPNTSLTIPPGGKVVITVTYQIESSDVSVPALSLSSAGGAGDIPASLVSQYTGTTSTFWADDPEIADLARNLTANEPTVLAKVARLVRWFNANVTYQNHEIPLMPDQTLSQLEGDCDDQSILLISMLRSLGIPAYLEIGIVFNSGISGEDTYWDGHLKIKETGLAWHGWAMVYTPPWGWIPVDLTLVSDNDPLQMIKKAPQYSAPVVTAMKISEQTYTTAGEETRQRIIDSTIYISSVETAEGVQAGWINQTMILLAVGISAAVAIMFYTSRRRQQPI